MLLDTLFYFKQTLVVTLLLAQQCGGHKHFLAIDILGGMVQYKTGFPCVALAVPELTL